MELNQDYFEKKFNGIDGKFKDIDKKFKNIDRKFDHIDSKLENIDKKFIALESKMDTGFAKVHRHIDQKIEWLAQLVASTIALPHQKQLDNHEFRLSRLDQNKTVA